MPSRRRRLPIILFIGSFFMLSVHNSAQAAVISTQQYLSAVERQTALDTVDAALAREEVQRQLKQFGVEPEQAMARVAALNDQELALLAEKFDELPAGGDLLGVIGIVFIVLLILELVGVTNIFNRI